MPSIIAEFKGRDLIEIHWKDQEPPHLQAVGCSELLHLIRRYQIQYSENLRLWPIPIGASHAEMLLREALLKLQQQWKFPYEHMEICHCRSVPTEKVDQAILAGAATCEAISRQTGASTACGTCRADVENILKYRLANPQK